MKRVILKHNTYKLILAMCMWLIDYGMAFSQEFSVSSFKVLPNDVSAFVNTVRDLNDEACALVKVEAPSDFAFSTPLGIVKRKDEVGEIWLYLPKGTKMLTIKHPVWGVMRDYKFNKALESRMTYELKLNIPRITITEKHDTIVQIRTVVDTITMTTTRPKLPLSIYTLATIGFHDNCPSYGVFFAIMRRHGLFVHACSDLSSTGNTIGNCAKDGTIANTSYKPYYTGTISHSHFTVSTGAIHYVAKCLRIFEGIGYGRHATAWQLAESEGGGYVLNDDLTHKGIVGELGLISSFGRIAISASTITIAGKHWQGCIGVGIKL